MKKILFILAMLYCPALFAATLTPNTIPYVCQGGTNPQLCSSNATTDSNGNSGIVPTGGIIEWYGSIASIPPGWTLCNGVSVERTDGKGMIVPPDLRNRFIVGADNDVTGIANSSVTGSETVNGNGQLPSTSASITWDSSRGGVGPGCSGSKSDPFASGTTNCSGISNSIAVASFGSGSNVVAVYYALAFIMKT